MSDSNQDKKINMEIDDAGDIVEVENDDNSDKKTTFKYRRLYDDVRNKSALKKTLAFFKTWSWLFALVLLLISIILMAINYFTVNIFIFLNPVPRLSFLSSSGPGPGQGRIR